MKRRHDEQEELEDITDNTDNGGTDGTDGVLLDEEEIMVEDQVYESFSTQYQDDDDQHDHQLQDQEAHLDNWLEGIDKQEMENAKKVHEKRMQVEREEMHLEYAIGVFIKYFDVTCQPWETVSDLIRRHGRNKSIVGELTEAAVSFIDNGVYEVYEFTVADIQDLQRALR